jgi:hypothetical protein
LLLADKLETRRSSGTVPGDEECVRAVPTDVDSSL